MRLTTSEFVEVVGIRKVVFSGGHGSHREAGRVDIEAAAWLVLDDSPGCYAGGEEGYPVLVHDVSVNGMGLFSNHAMMRGNQCVIRLQPRGGDGKQRMWRCRVARCERIGDRKGTGLVNLRRGRAWDYVIGVEFVAALDQGERVAG